MVDLGSSSVKGRMFWAIHARNVVTVGGASCAGGRVDDDQSASYPVGGFRPVSGFESVAVHIAEPVSIADRFEEMWPSEHPSPCPERLGAVLEVDEDRSVVCFDSLADGHDARARFSRFLVSLTTSSLGFRRRGLRRRLW